jgi:hypothetical protein
MAKAVQVVQAAEVAEQAQTLLAITTTQAVVVMAELLVVQATQALAHRLETLELRAALVMA